MSSRHENNLPRLTLSNCTHQLIAESGELILLRGDVGCGKTLWLKRMAGLLDLPAEMNKNINMNPTDHAVVRMLFDRWPCLWLGGSVEEELIFGLGHTASPHELEDVLLTWRLADLSLDHDVQRLNRLQSIRLSLAAIALAKPDFVFLDNPSAALCAETAMLLSQDIAAWLKHSNTIVVVASNRWQDWRTVATQTWSVSAPDHLPVKIEAEHNDSSL